MALLTDIRNNLAKAFGIFAALFIIYVVLDWGMDILGRRSRGRSEDDPIGVVNGEKITYKYFSEILRRTMENYKQQNGVDPDEETERQLRLQVWNQIIDEMLIQEEIKRLGLTVTDQEIRDIVQSQNPPEFLARQFRDSAGVFQREAYEQAMFDPQNKEAWIQVEDILREEQKRNKLQSILLASVQVSESEVRQKFIDQNTTLEADYVLFEANRFIPDSAITVTDRDLKKVYEERAEQFKSKESRKIKYVLFPIRPSSADSQSVFDEVNHLKEQITSGTLDFLEAANTYSEVPVNEAFFAHGELSRQKEDAVFNAPKGAIVGPIIDTDGCHLIKVIDFRQGTTEFVKVRHILLNTEPGADSVKVLEQAKDLMKQIRSGADFGELAKKYSQDYGSAAQGGSLGWAKKGMFVKPFEDAMFRTSVGQVTGPVRSQYGWHIIKVEGRDKREVKIAALTLKIKPSTETTDAIFKQAEDFVYIAKDEGFEKAAENSQYEVRETPEFTEEGYIPGIGANDIITSFAFNNKVGKISDPISIQQAYVVCTVSSIRKEGIRPFDEVKPALQSMALHNKKMEALYPQVEAFYKTLKPESDIISEAAAIPNVIAQKTGPFKPSAYPPGVGRDLKFIGTALGLNVGQISKPVDGTRGYYIIKLTSKTPFDSAQYKLLYKQIYQQLLQEKQNAFFTQWITSLRDKAEIKDNRLHFYR
ncbi:MAG: peptidylprolyl isomerase [Bacteroidetes bacterium]|nr:peptidylprolyl isomerase [Bacteroidota bacterium]